MVIKTRNFRSMQNMCCTYCMGWWEYHDRVLMFYCRDGIDQRVEARNDSIIVHVITLLCCRINRDPMIMEDRQLIWHHMRVISLLLIRIEHTMRYWPQHVIPLHQRGVLKYKQGCLTKGRLLYAKDGRLSVWHADQLVWSYLWCQPTNQGTMTLS